MTTQTIYEWVEGNDADGWTCARHDECLDAPAVDAMTVFVGTGLLLTVLTLLHAAGLS